MLLHLFVVPEVEHVSAGQKLGGFGGSLAAKPKPGAHLKELGHILRELAPSLWEVMQRPAQS